MRSVLLTLALMALPLSAAELRDPFFGFTTRIPESFQKFSPLHLRYPKRIDHCYLLGDPKDDQPDVMLAIHGLGGTLTQEQMSLRGVESFASGFRFTKEEVTWKDLDLPLYTGRGVLNQIDLVTVAVQVPLQRQAIQITAAGPAHRYYEILGYARFVLDHLEGETNWKTGAQRLAELAPSLIRLAITLVIVGGVIILLVRRQRRRPPPPMLVPGPALLPPRPPTSESDAREPSPPPPPEELIPVCPTCGLRVTHGRRRCMNCGRDLATP